MCPKVYLGEQVIGFGQGRTSALADFMKELRAIEHPIAHGRKWFGAVFAFQANTSEFSDMHRNRYKLEWRA